MKKGFVLLGAIGLLFLSQASSAFAEMSAKDFVKELFEKGIRAATDTLGEQERAQKLQLILETYFDIPTVREFTLGRHRGNMTGPQRAEYQKLFVQYVVALYGPPLKKFAEGQAGSLKIVKEEYYGSDTVVTSRFIREGEDPITIGWRVRKDNRGQKIIDIRFDESISIVSTLRDQIVSIVDRGGIDMLLEKLEAKVKELD